MTTFIIYPAIDLRHGRVVRLEYGDPKRQTIFSDDPVTVGQLWLDQGAEWLHVVNLDGAFEEANRENWQLLPGLAERGAKIQFGGGLRSMTDVERALALGATRVILGTAAVKDPDLVVREGIRVLKKGGSFIFMEHQLPRMIPQALMFRMVTPLWKAPSGCHLNRKTEELIDGMDELEKVESSRSGPVLGFPFYIARYVKK